MCGFNFKQQVNNYIQRTACSCSRLKAYDICHEKFVTAIKTSSFNYDELALHLYAFLASYGMVCRKSVLLKHNYKLLIEVVKIVCDKKYKFLLDIDIFSPSFNKSNYIKSVLELKDELSKCLKLKKGSNDTLTSKIILGTLGCVPAYDRNVRQKLHKFSMCKSFSQNGLNGLIKFANYYQTDIQDMQTTCKTSGMDYSVMKVIDCALWI